VKTTYPNFIEIIKFTALAFDLQPKCKKDLDDLEDKVVADPHKLNYLFDTAIKARFEHLVGKDIGGQLSYKFRLILDDYSSLVSKIDVSGLRREQVISPLVECFLIGHILSIFDLPFMSQLKATPSLILTCERNAVVDILEWLSKTNPQSIKAMTKEDRDLVLAWRKGQYIPSSSSLSRLIDNDLHRTFILIACTLERLKKFEYGKAFVVSTRSRLLGLKSKEIPFEKAASNLQSHLKPRLDKFGSDIGMVQDKLRRTKVKKPEDKDDTDFSLKHLEKGYSCDELPNNSYFVHHHRARWHVYCGNLDQANVEYEKTIDLAALMAGEEQRGILKEAKAVAASLNSPDKVLLKKIRWIEQTFRYDIESLERAEPSNKFTDTIEGWELDLWKQSFCRLFPKDGFFPGHDYPEINLRTGFISMTDEDSRIILDLKCPNKKVWLGLNKQKKTHQLIWFSEKGDTDSVKALLEAGASVDVKSDVDETALIFALEAMNLNDYRSNFDDSLFRAISSIPHKSETINSRTQKKRKTALSLAVRTGKLWVVQKVLSMGADVHLLSGSDRQTALNLAMKSIALLKDIEKVIRVQREPDDSDIAVDSFRRETNGLFGADLESNRKVRNVFLNEFNLYGDDHMLQWHENLKKHSSVRELIDIARELIFAGSNPNAEHETPLKGYTPLMLAAENDEKELFELMIQYGGDASKSYIDPRNGNLVTLEKITMSFRAKNVLAYLKRNLLG
jgi:ankyrin repeat protein